MPRIPSRASTATYLCTHLTSIESDHDQLVAREFVDHRPEDRAPIRIGRDGHRNRIDDAVGQSFERAVDVSRCDSRVRSNSPVKVDRDGREAFLCSGGEGKSERLPCKVVR